MITLIMQGWNRQAVRRKADCQKVADIYDEYVPKMVNAASQEDCVAQYDAMISSMETAGLVKLEEVMTKNYLAKMERWGVEPYSHR